MNNEFQLKGFLSAPFTPMESDGAINYTIIPEYAQRLKRAGIAGVYVGGTTGESLSLTRDERMKLAEAWLEEQSDDFAVVVHTGSEALTDTLELAVHAKEIGAAAVGNMPPVFFKPALTELTAMLEKIAAACAPLPYYFYHIPSMTGVNVSIPDLLSECGRRIPNFRGIKYTHHDLMEYSLLNACQEGKFDILYGRDETLLAGLSMGATGMIGSTYNYAMPVYAPLLEAFRTGDMSTALEQQRLSQKIVQILIRYGGGISAGKAFLGLAGLDAGPCRLPNRSLDENTLKSAVEELKRDGVYEYLRI